MSFGVIWAMLVWLPLATSAESFPRLPEDVLSFIKAKETQALSLAAELKIEVSSDVWAFFATARGGDVVTITNAFDRLKSRTGQYQGSRHDTTVTTPIFQTVIEVVSAAEAFGFVGERYTRMFGDSVMNSIPPKSIYFGGTDPGRGVITSLSKSHADGDPFFTITQNVLADENYLRYLRAMYSGKVRIPGTNDSQRAFGEYMEDVRKRLDHDRRFPNKPRQMKAGEDVRVVNGQEQVSGQVAVMSINALLAKVIFEANPDREFYIEESFPLDWMYPHLSPHGFILKLNRQPLPELSSAAMTADRDFWVAHQKLTIGDWLTPSTPVSELCAWVEKIYIQRDYTGFQGDRAYVENPWVTKAYSKLRAATGGIYAWRVNDYSLKLKAYRSNRLVTVGESPQKLLERDQGRMLQEAHFAFKQAFALGPSNPEALFRYAALLTGLHDQNPKGGFLDDAILLGTTGLKIDPKNEMIPTLLSHLNAARNTQLEAKQKVADAISKAEEAYRNQSTNLQAAINLVSAYYKAGRQQDAFDVLDGILARPNLNYEGVSVVAEAYRQLQNVPKLESTLVRLTQIMPQSPEAWYDLAMIQATLRKNVDAVTSLSNAVHLSDLRLKTDNSKKNLRTHLTSDSRFDKLRSLPEFQKIISPPK